mgnify:FL=1
MSMKGLIVCGTDTDIGKTAISALLVQGLNATYWKPIQSGIIDGGDSSQVKKILNLSEKRLVPEAYIFKAAVSPHWAAELEGISIDLDNLNIPNIEEFLIVETAGGLLVPLTRKILQIDLIKKWQLPVILVAKTGLGTLNHTLLSVEALRNRNIPILGLILNGPNHKDNPKTLEDLTKLPLIANIPKFPKLNREDLANTWVEQNISAKLIRLLGNS